jgi:hypothetical protein
MFELCAADSEPPLGANPSNNYMTAESGARGAFRKTQLGPRPESRNPTFPSDVTVRHRRWARVPRRGWPEPNFPFRRDGNIRHTGRCSSAKRRVKLP